MFMFKKYTFKMFKNSQNQAMILGGVNTAGILSLAAYTVRTLNEVNSNLEEMRFEMEQIKSTFSENNKRSNVAFNRLNQRIEENIQTVHNSNHVIEGMKNQVRKIKLSGNKEVKKVVELEEDSDIEEIPEIRTRKERVDEITSALNELMRN